MIVRRRGRTRPPLWFRLALFGALVSLMAFAVARSIGRRSSGIASAHGTESNAFPADYPRGVTPCPEFQLVDQTGAAFDPSRLRGGPAIVVFVFSHCQAICPGLVHEVREAIQALGSDPVQLVMITIDPERDTPDTLPQIAKDWQLGPEEWLLSGPSTQVERLLDSFDVARERDANGQVAHPPLVVVLDPEGRQAYRLNAPSAGWIVEAVRRSRKG